MEKNESRIYKIINELFDRDSYISIGALAKKCNCTERTIRTDISCVQNILSEYGIKLLYKNKQGYLLENNKFEHIPSDLIKRIEENYGEIPDDYSTRVTYILKRLLKSFDYVKIDELAVELYTSRNTISVCLKKVREILLKYNLLLENKSHYGLKVTGDEISIRKIIYDYVIEDKSLNIQNSENKRLKEEGYFLGINVDFIYSLVKEEVNINGIKYFENFFNEMMINFLINIGRVINKKYISLDQINIDAVNINILRVAINITNQINEKMNIIFPESEIYYLASMLEANRILNIDSEKLYLDDTYFLVNKMLVIASKEFEINFAKDETLKYDLYVHLKSALKRLELGIQLHNPLVEELKDSYPFAFEITIFVCYNKEIGLYDLGKSELGYIVLHFAAALERFVEHSEINKKVLIYCSSGIGTVRLLESKLKREFKNLIEIDTIYDSSSLSYKEDDYDLILSTIPMEFNQEKVVQVSPILTSEDIAKISRKLFKLKNNKLYDISEVFHLNLFKIVDNKKEMTKEELLSTVILDLVDLDYVEDNFYNEIMEREKILDTVIGNQFAIPHPMRNIAKKSVIYICVLKNPIEWIENKPVSIVFVLSIKRNEAKFFKKIYELIAEIASDIEKVHKLSECNDYDSFMIELKKFENEIKEE